MTVTRQQHREMHDRRARVTHLIGDRPLSARSVLATALLGADQPHLTVAELVAMASLFGISDGAARTCLWRMVSNGDLTTDDGSYALAGGLLERRERVDEASRTAAARPWGGTWELAIVSLERRSAADRLALRKAASALHLAELREGVWIRPDNLEPDRLPGLRAILDRQCVHFHDAASDIPAETVRSLFDLEDWADDAHRLTQAMGDELDAEVSGADDFAYRFALSVAVVRHLQLDPLLPKEFTPKDSPAHELRNTYRRFDEVFKQLLNNAFR
jgi:phenylacetic acid degradation operon negative regulatory protein